MIYLVQCFSETCLSLAENEKTKWNKQGILL